MYHPMNYSDNLRYTNISISPVARPS
ncbi:hypothetical protein F383_26735 [Gossypium arboreum]|uniref:Uncharacterized protein n=1 Tax=Gossypium arboreum TaxID=29729 RepID=A0A0B0MRH9_GOSAR|nr:hypothetical protein F383_26735 [Gossypium arboreum]